MTHLDRSDLAVRRLRVIKDALWSLTHDYSIGAMAMLQAEVNRTNQEEMSGVTK